MVGYRSIKKRQTFLDIKRDGTTIKTKSLVAQYVKREDVGLYLGLTVTKKIGNAVIRNRVKRRYRAAFRQILKEHPVEHMSIVLLARHAAIDVSYERLLQDMRQLFQEIGSIKCQSL